MPDPTLSTNFGSVLFSQKTAAAPGCRANAVDAQVFREKEILANSAIKGRCPAHSRACASTDSPQPEIPVRGP